MLTTHFQKPLTRDIAFFIVLCFGMWVVGWDSTLGKMQSEPHLWRQSDCISIAEYYAKGNGFFTPEMHARISDDGTTGKTVAEFPIIYYIVGKIWSVTGVQLWIFRLFSGLFGIVALLCLYKTLLRLTNGSWLWSALGPLLVLASPIYAFYGIGFLTNVPAFNCTLIAWCFFHRYYSGQAMKHLVWASVFFALSGLLKVSALTSYVLLLFVFTTEALRIISYKKITGEDGIETRVKIFTKPLIAGAILLLPAVLSLSWQLGFVEPYCIEHGGRYSFTSPVPIWTYTAEQREHIWDVFFRYTVHQVYPGYIWLFFIAVFLFLVSRWKKINPFWLIAVPAIFIGHTAFSLLFFFCLDSHDYYHIDIILFFVLVYAALIKYLRNHEETILNARFTKFVAVIAVWYALLGCGNNLHMRFLGYWGQEAYSEQFSNKSTMELFQYLRDLMELKKSYFKVGDELTARGFSNETPVIAINDGSFNSVLILVDRPGFTNMADIFADSATTAWRVQRGAEVLMVEYAENEHRGVSKFMDHKLFTVDHISVYDLRPYRK